MKNLAFSFYKPGSQVLTSFTYAYKGPLLSETT